MIFRTPASRFVPVLLALLALGGCAPVESDDDLALGEDDQALISEVGFPGLDGAGKDAASFLAAQQGATIRYEVEFRSSTQATRVFEASVMTWQAGRIRLVLEGTSQHAMDALTAHPPTSAVVLHLDKDGGSVLESVHTGIKLIGHPRVVNTLAGRFSVEFAYNAFSLATP
jgi:hypothetical protein